MILEQAVLPVKDGQEADFERAFAQAKGIIAAMPGFRGLTLSRCLERPSTYLLLVEWDRLEDHTEGFRNAPAHQEWKALLHPFYDPSPVVEHYRPVLSDGTCAVIELRTPGELDAMRAAGAVVADMHAAVRAIAAPGVRLTQLDAVARDVLSDAGADLARSSGTQPLSTTPPFPGVVCLSVNDVALHGIPTPEVLEDGDLLSVDAGATLDGWVGDAAITFPVGTPRPDDLALVATTERALAAGIAAAVVGNRIGDVSAAIGAVGRAGGCGINTDQGGHGVGRHDARAAARAQRGARRPRRAAAGRAGHRDRAVVPGRRQRRLPRRRRRLDAAQRRRQPRRPRRAHRRRHRRRPPHPDPAALTDCAANGRDDCAHKDLSHGP